MAEAGIGAQLRSHHAEHGRSRLHDSDDEATSRPLHDRVLVKRLEAQDEQHGRIVIPDTAKEKPQEGTVMAVGGGRVTEEGKKLLPEVKPGDRILFGKYSGNEIRLDSEEYLLMKEEDVLGILFS